MFQPQAAIFDIDGTLFDYQNQQVPPSAQAALQQLREREVTIIVATGRAYAMLPHQLRRILSPHYYVLSNGHAILDDSGVCMHATRFSPQQTQLAVELCCQYATAFLLNYPNRCYAYTGYTELYRIAGNIGPLDAEAFLDCPKQDIHLVEQPIGFTIKSDHQLRELLSQRTETFRVEPFRDNTEYDVFAPGVNKMIGLQNLLEKLSIDPEQCIAFGDGSNDVEMIAGMGMGIAMGNACDHLKAVANRVCLPSWEDGIYTMLKELQAI